MLSHRQKIQHLYQRAAFGIAPDHLDKIVSYSIPQIVQNLLNASRRYQSLGLITDPTKGRRAGFLKVALLFIKSRGQLRKLNLAWLEQMTDTRAQLREKMTLFWHDHFATQVPIAYLMQEQNNTLRHHALGSFRRMLHAVAKDPAMLIYLNNQQNKKDAPNENFARELLELFTFGEGQAYTEGDIKEAARAFTGWTVNMRGQFEFVATEHDYGLKKFLGKRGNFSGEEILDIILDHPRTAYFIAHKVYTYFVHPEPHKARIEELAEAFYASDYDIGLLMAQIFLSDWFYDPVQRGALVKSPVELIVHLQRLLGLNFRHEKVLLLGQDALGQVLFFPPNVAGWPHGINWIDSSTLLLRMRLPLLILGLHKFDIAVKPEYESMGMQDNPNHLPPFLQPQVQWQPWLRHFRDVPMAQLPQAVSEALLLSPKAHVDTQLVKDFADDSSREALIKSLIIRTLALPEFQLG